MSETHCLIVDDSRMARMMVKKFIGDIHPQWPIEEAASGEEALEKAAEQKFDLITLDYNMPGMDGIEVAEIIRPRLPDARIVLLTANVQDSIRTQADELGLDFIAKPINEEKIIDYVSQTNPEPC